MRVAFRAIWYAGSLHEISRRMELLVLSWLILQTTGSPFQLGLVLVFNNLPRPVLSLFSGVIADRYSRVRILVMAQAVNTLLAGTILSLLILDLVSSWHVFLAVVMRGSPSLWRTPLAAPASWTSWGRGVW